ncbi:hypothetical protein GCM10010302_26720 [Streptomyces polychromogenes]|uniref:Uncharacterized protein n=1 Tax=Streptomyces polychromogenes TaxID=67342 RepID=A0ABN0VCZ8_9ACTN
MNNEFILAGAQTALGDVGGGGMAVIFATVLILGVKGKGKKRLASVPAVVVGIFAGVEFDRAGDPWNTISQSLHEVVVETSSSGDLGTMGPGFAALFLLALFFYLKLSPAVGAILGLLMSSAWAAAPESVWRVPLKLVGTLLGIVGG